YYYCMDFNLDVLSVFFFQAEDGIRDFHVTGVQTCALPILSILSNSERNSSGLKISRQMALGMIPAACSSGVRTSRITAWWSFWSSSLHSCCVIFFIIILFQTVNVGRLPHL